MPSRRTLLAAGAFVLVGLGVRRAHALRDPSELSVGGSTGAHDAHISCGPDVRVRHANAGLHYERVFQAEGQPEGRGIALEVNAAAGSTTITNVAPASNPSQSDLDTARDLSTNEQGRAHWLGTVQVGAGWDWRTFALRGGLGWFGFSDVTADHRAYVAHYYPLPTLDMRIGQRHGFRGDLGLGPPPIPGLARWYSLYGLLSYRFAEGGEVGVGHVIAIGGALDERMGVVFKGAFPVTKSLYVGGFGMFDADDKSHFTGFNWSAGGGLTLLLDQDD